VILTHLFGDNFEYMDTSDLRYIGMQRHFDSFLKAADETSISRFYGGIHYQSKRRCRCRTGQANRRIYLEQTKIAELKTGMSLQNWQAIVSYYKKFAPDTLAAAKAPAPLLNDWAGFTLKKAARSNDICFTTMIAANPKNGKIYTGDVVSGNLTEWDSQLNATKAVKLPSAAVSLGFLPDSAGIQQAIVSCIGRLDPVDFPNGESVEGKPGRNPAAQPGTIRSAKAGTSPECRF
jgi:hypothetical protein